MTDHAVAISFLPSALALECVSRKNCKLVVGVGVGFKHFVNYANMYLIISHVGHTFCRERTGLVMLQPSTMAETCLAMTNQIYTLRLYPLSWSSDYVTC